MATNTTTIYTKVRNTSGVDMFFAFLGPRGTFLTAGSDYKVAGRLEDLWAKNDLHLAAYQHACEQGLLEVLKTPDAYYFDTTATRVRKLQVDNGSVTVADPDFGSYTGAAPSV